MWGAEIPKRPTSRVLSVTSQNVLALTTETTWDDLEGVRSAHPRSSPTPQPLSAAQPCLRQQKSPQRGSVEPHRPKSATNGHSQHQARDGARANLAGLGARGPGAEGTYPPDYPSCARNPPRLPTLWPPTAFIMANWATCGRAERASKKARLPGECRVCSRVDKGSDWTSNGE